MTPAQTLLACCVFAAVLGVATSAADVAIQILARRYNERQLRKSQDEAREGIARMVDEANIRLEDAAKRFQCPCPSCTRLRAEEARKARPS